LLRAAARAQYVQGRKEPVPAFSQADVPAGRYLSYLRETMSAAVEDFIPFDEAYDAIDWSEFEQLPAFAEVNRRNAYQVYLSMEAESLSDPE
jgi:hypothetical protein